MLSSDGLILEFLAEDTTQMWFIFSFMCQSSELDHSLVKSILVKLLTISFLMCGVFLLALCQHLSCLHFYSCQSAVVEDLGIFHSHCLCSGGMYWYWELLYHPNSAIGCSQNMMLIYNLLDYLPTNSRQNECKL
jgi:hypothetical protein